MKKIAGPIFATLLATTFMHAQIPTSGNVFFGYSYSGGDVYSNRSFLVPTQRTSSLNGWEASGEGKFLPWVGIVVDVAGHYGSRSFAFCPPPGTGISCGAVRLGVNAGEHTFLFGPRLSVPIRKFTPYVHFLFGVAHISDSGGGASNSDTTFSYALGGGVDYKLIKAVAWRLQGDSVHTSFFGGDQDHFRFSTGIVVRF